MLKEIKEDWNKWKDIYIHGLEGNFVKMAILPVVGKIVATSRATSSS